MKIRQMQMTDLPAVTEIENRTFPMGWLPSMFEAEIDGPVSHAVVLLTEGKIIGYAVYRVVIDEAHLLNIAVSAQHRCKSFGRTLLNHIVDDSTRLGAENVYLEVRETNTIAQTMYSTSGFVFVGRRRGYYQDNGEDALVMAKPLVSPEHEDENQ